MAKFLEGKKYYKKLLSKAKAASSSAKKSSTSSTKYAPPKSYKAEASPTLAADTAKSIKEAYTAVKKSKGVEGTPIQSPLEIGRYNNKQEDLVRASNATSRALTGNNKILTGDVNGLMPQGISQWEYKNIPKENKLEGSFERYQARQKKSLNKAQDFLKTDWAKNWEKINPDEEDRKNVILDPYSTLPTSYTKEFFELFRAAFTFNKKTFFKEAEDLGKLFYNKVIRIPYAMSIGEINDHRRAVAVEAEQKKQAGLDPDNTSLYVYDQKHGIVTVITGQVQGDEYSITQGNEGFTATTLPLKEYNKFARDKRYASKILNNTFYVDNSKLGESKEGAQDGILYNSVQYRNDGTGYFSYNTLRQALKSASKKNNSNNSRNYLSIDAIYYQDAIESANKKAIKTSLENQNASLPEAEQIPLHYSNNHSIGVATLANTILPALNGLDLSRSILAELAMADTRAHNENGALISEALYGSPKYFRREREGKHNTALAPGEKGYKTLTGSDVSDALKRGYKQEKDNTYTSYFLDQKKGSPDYVKHPYLWGISLDIIADPLTYIDLASIGYKVTAKSVVRDALNPELSKAVGKHLDDIAIKGAKVENVKDLKNRHVVTTVKKGLLEEHATEKALDKKLSKLSIPSVSSVRAEAADDVIDDINVLSKAYDSAVDRRTRKQIINTLTNDKIKNKSLALKKVLQNRGYNPDLADIICSGYKTALDTDVYKTAKTIAKYNTRISDFLEAIDMGTIRFAFPEVTVGVEGVKLAKTGITAQILKHKKPVTDAVLRASNIKEVINKKAGRALVRDIRAARKSGDSFPKDSLIAYKAVRRILNEPCSVDNLRQSAYIDALYNPKETQGVRRGVITYMAYHIDNMNATLKDIALKSIPIEDTPGILKAIKQQKRTLKDASKVLDDVDITDVDKELIRKSIKAHDDFADAIMRKILLEAEGTFYDTCKTSLDSFINNFWNTVWNVDAPQKRAVLNTDITNTFSTLKKEYFGIKRRTDRVFKLFSNAFSDMSIYQNNLWDPAEELLDFAKQRASALSLLSTNHHHTVNAKPLQSFYEECSILMGHFIDDIFNAYAPIKNIATTKQTQDVTRALCIKYEKLFQEALDEYVPYILDKRYQKDAQLFLEKCLEITSKRGVINEKALQENIDVLRDLFSKAKPAKKSKAIPYIDNTKKIPSVYQSQASMEAVDTSKEVLKNNKTILLEDTAKYNYLESQRLAKETFDPEAKAHALYIESAARDVFSQEYPYGMTLGEKIGEDVVIEIDYAGNLNEEAKKVVDFLEDTYYPGVPYIKLPAFYTELSNEEKEVVMALAEDYAEYIDTHNISREDLNDVDIFHSFIEEYEDLHAGLSDEALEALHRFEEEFEEYHKELYALTGAEDIYTFAEHYKNLYGFSDEDLLEFTKEILLYHYTDVVQPEEFIKYSPGSADSEEIKAFMADNRLIEKEQEAGLPHNIYDFAENDKSKKGINNLIRAERSKKCANIEYIENDRIIKVKPNLKVQHDYIGENYISLFITPDQVQCFRLTIDHVNTEEKRLIAAGKELPDSLKHLREQAQYTLDTYTAYLAMDTFLQALAEDPKIPEALVQIMSDSLLNFQHLNLEKFSESMMYGLLTNKLQEQASYQMADKYENLDTFVTSLYSATQTKNSKKIKEAGITDKELKKYLGNTHTSDQDSKVAYFKLYLEHADEWKKLNKKLSMGEHHAFFDTETLGLSTKMDENHIFSFGVYFPEALDESATTREVFDNIFKREGASEEVVYRMSRELYDSGVRPDDDVLCKIMGTQDVPNARKLFEDKYVAKELGRDEVATEEMLIAQISDLFMNKFGTDIQKSDIILHGFNSSRFDEPLLKQYDTLFNDFFSDMQYEDVLQNIYKEKGIYFEQADIDYMLGSHYFNYARTLKSCTEKQTRVYKLYDTMATGVMYANERFNELLKASGMSGTESLKTTLGDDASILKASEITKYLQSQNNYYIIHSFENARQDAVYDNLWYKVTKLLHPDASEEDIIEYVAAFKNVQEFIDIPNRDVYEYWFHIARVKPEALDEGVELTADLVAKAEQLTGGMPKNINRYINGVCMEVLNKEGDALAGIRQPIGISNTVPTQASNYFDTKLISEHVEYVGIAVKNITRYKEQYPIRLSTVIEEELEKKFDTAFTNLKKLLEPGDFINEIKYADKDLNTKHAIVLETVNRINTQVKKGVKILYEEDPDKLNELLDIIENHPIDKKKEYFQLICGIPKAQQEKYFELMGDLPEGFKINNATQKNIELPEEYKKYFEELYYSKEEYAKTTAKSAVQQMTGIAADITEDFHNMNSFVEDISGISNMSISPEAHAAMAALLPLEKLARKLADYYEDTPERAQTFVYEVVEFFSSIRRGRTTDIFNRIKEDNDFIFSLLFNSDHNGLMVLTDNGDELTEEILQICGKYDNELIVTYHPPQKCYRVALKDSCYRIEDGKFYVNGKLIEPEDVAHRIDYNAYLNENISDEILRGHLSQTFKNLYRSAPTYLPDISMGRLSFDDFYDVVGELTATEDMYYIEDFAQQMQQRTLTSNFIYSTTGEMPALKKLKVGRDPLKTLRYTVKATAENMLDARANMAYYFNLQDAMSLNHMAETLSDEEILHIATSNSDSLVACAMVEDKINQKALRKLELQLKEAEKAGNLKKIERLKTALAEYQEASIIKIELTTPAQVEQAKRLNACMLPISVYESIAPNINKYTPLNPALRTWQKYVTLMKATYLTKLSTAFRNYIDETIKTVTDVGFENLPAFERNKLIAMQDYVDYRKIIAAIRKDMNSLHPLTSDTESTYARFLDAGILERTNKFDIPNSEIGKYYCIIANSGMVDPMVMERMDYNKFMRMHGFQLYGASGGTQSGEIQARLMANNIPDLSTAAAKGSRKELFKEFGNLEDKTLSDYGAMGTYLFDSMISTMMSPMAATEMVTRYAHMLTLEEMGVTDLEAFGRISKTHFNYDIKDRATVYAQMVIPFFNFNKLNLDYWMNMYIDHPNDIKALLSVQRSVTRGAAEDESEARGNGDYVDTTALSQYLSGNIPFFNISEVPGQEAFLRINPSFYDAFAFFTDPINQGLNDLFSPLKSPLQELPIFSAAVAQGIWDGEYYNSKTSWIPLLGSLYFPTVQQTERMIEKTYSRNKNNALATFLKSPFPISMHVPGFFAFSVPEQTDELYDYLNANGYYYDYVTQSIQPEQNCKARTAEEFKLYMKKANLAYDTLTNRVVPNGLDYDKNDTSSFLTWDSMRAVAREYNHEDYDYVTGKWVPLGSTLPAIYGTNKPIFDYDEYRDWQANRGFIYDYVRKKYVKEGTEIANSVEEAAEYQRAHGKEWDYVLKRYVPTGTALASNYDEAKTYWYRERGFIYDYARKAYVKPGFALAPDWNSYKEYQSKKGLEYDYSTREWVPKGTAKVSDWRDLKDFSSTWKTYDSNYAYSHYKKFDTWEEVQAYQRQNGKEWDAIKKTWVKLGTAPTWEQYSAYKREQGLGWDSIHKQWVTLDKVPSWNQYQQYMESLGKEWDFIKKEFVPIGTAQGKTWQAYKNYGTLHNQTYNYMTRTWNGRYKSSASNKAGAQKVFKNYPVRNYDYGSRKYNYVDSMIHKYITSDFPNARLSIRTMPTRNLYQVETRRVKKPMAKMRQAKYFSKQSYEKYYKAKF